MVGNRELGRRVFNASEERGHSKDICGHWYAVIGAGNRDCKSFQADAVNDESRVHLKMDRQTVNSRLTENSLCAETLGKQPTGRSTVTLEQVRVTSECGETTNVFRSYSRRKSRRKVGSCVQKMSEQSEVFRFEKL